jgi:hypothetical protein
VRETDAFMPPAYVGCGRHNVENEEEVLDVIPVKSIN